MQPLLSIVIANYNYGKYLGDAIRSIVGQCDDRPIEVDGCKALRISGTDDCVELIVCDAKSTDDSLEIIRSFEEKISWWCSEPDGGQSAAFNKGFSHSHGRFLTWLNADDIYLPGTFKELQKATRRHPSCQWFCGNFMRFNVHTGTMIEAAWGPHYVATFMQGCGFPISTFGPSTFWSRAAYDAIGGIDERLHYIMDSEYWARMVMSGYRYRRINHCCWGFRMHEASKTAEFGEHKRSEKVYNMMQEEKRYKENKTGYRVVKFKKLLAMGMRVLDGSAIVALYRRWFVVGKTLRDYYKTEGVRYE